MEKQKPLGKLSPVELREYWEKEDKDFTPWLAEEKNLSLLGKTIGMELEVQGTERLVSECLGGFKVDILAKMADCEEEHFVVIENQLQKTNHKHLGQLLTYASGLNAKAVVWIAQKFTDEHKKALDWLNEHSSEGVSFFGLEMELWQIGDSLPAPKFNVVSQPNDWARAIPRPIRKNPELSQKQLAFWTGFVEYMKSKPTPLKLKKPTSDHLYGFGIGHSGFRIRLTTNSVTNQLGCELRINETELGFNTLCEDKDRIEKELNAQLEWKKLPDRKSSVIVQYKAGNFQNQEEWPQLFGWLKERAEAFYNTFHSRIQNMDLSEEAA